MVKYNKNKKTKYLFHALPSYYFVNLIIPIISTISMDEHFVHLEMSK